MAKASVWIVEVWEDLLNKWSACDATATTREYGRSLLAEWRERNPIRRFRLVRYVREVRDDD